MRHLFLTAVACSLAGCPKQAAKPAAPAEPVVAEPIPAPSGAFADLATLLDTLEAKNRWQGSLALVREGEPMFVHPVGQRKPGGDPIDADTRLRIGSISKVFTAVLIHQLVSEGALSFDDTLASFGDGQFESIPNADRITIEQLLDHHSGVFSFTGLPDYPQWMEAPASRDDLIAKMSPAVFEPGARGEYSNSNYVLLGWIVEEVTGQSLSAALNERIAVPAGLSRTMLGDGIQPRDNEARSQRWDGTEWVPETETDPSIPGGAGAVVSTPTDLCRFAEALFTGDLLDPAGLEHMMTLEDSYGHGLFTFPYGKRTAWGHTGGIDGFSSMLGWFEDDDSCIALVTFGDNLVERDTNSLAIEALGVLNGGSVSNPDVADVVVLDVERITAWEGVYSTDALPLDMTLKLDGSVLTGQGTGQGAFPLTPLDADTFVFAPAGVTIRLGEPGQFTLEQGGGSFAFTRTEADDE